MKARRKSSEHPAIPQTAIDQLAVPGIAIRHRAIAPGDEDVLLPQESVASANTKMRRASGSARMAARELLANAGFRNCTIPRAASGAPIWPSQFVGALAHDADVAVAAVASHRDFAGIGIDIEPAETLPGGLLQIVATPAERSHLTAYICGGRLLFVVKEAVYKAVAALDRIFLDYRDVEVDFAGRQAMVRNGRTVEFRFCISTHLLALAFIRRTPSIQ